jgi:ElaB/YqjD/DUF883 family membrane-anchored ribosome-binding protein
MNFTALKNAALAKVSSVAEKAKPLATQAVAKVSSVAEKAKPLATQAVANAKPYMTVRNAKVVGIAAACVAVPAIGVIVGAGLALMTIEKEEK